MFPGRARYQRAATAGAITALAITIGLGVLAMLAARVNKSPFFELPRERYGPRPAAEVS